MDDYLDSAAPRQPAPAKAEEKRFAASSVLRESSTDKPLKETLARELMPRETLLSRGRKALSDDQLLAILLRTGVAGCNVMELARALLGYYGSLRALVSATPDELLALGLPGLNAAKVATICAALEIAQRIMSEPLGSRDPCKTPAVVADLLRSRMIHFGQEVFVALPLDRKNHLIGSPVEISMGTVSMSIAHPREVFRVCVRLSASAVIVAHNHPSGDPMPSNEDLVATRQLVEAGRVIGIPLLDHVIIGDPAVRRPGFVSLRMIKAVKFD